MRDFDPDHWAVILGGSSGFGLATADKLSRHGMNVVVVHRDRRGAMARLQPAFDAIAARVGFRAYNVDALVAEGRTAVLDGLAAAMGPRGRVRMILHSIAFGNLRGIVPTGAPDENVLTDEDFARTVHAMGTSLVGWVQELHDRKLFADDARVLAMTSEGNRVAWHGYAAVSAAKGALEACARSIALECAPHGIRANIIQAGVTDTPALRLIPRHDEMLAGAARRNPYRRLTRPEDVASFICLMCTDEAAWVNGSVLIVDGGEHIGG